jgi:5-methylcytosine-specific restriction enzyme subunit McrC
VSTNVEIFEYQTIRVGESLRTVDGHEARLTQRHFDDLARFNDAHDRRFFTIGHRRITATQYVGYVEVGDLAIEILPKADRASVPRTTAAWRDGLLEMLAVATGLRLQSPSSASQRTRRSSLLELVVARFIEELSLLLHQGLAKGYREDEQNGSTFRGRLAMAEHLRANVARADRFYVRTQTYDVDLLLNRILGAALAEIDGLALSNSIRARVDTCRADFPEIGDLRPTTETFRRIRLGRATLRYENALHLAQMILEHNGPQLRAGATRVFALLFDMNVLWERYVAGLFRQAAGDDLEISTQERRTLWSGGLHRRGVRPDIVVRSRTSGTVLLIADTKWKVLREGPPSDGDLQQMFIYNELLSGPRAALVYPGAGESGVSGLYSDRLHGCETIHLTPVVGTRWCASTMRAQIAAMLARFAKTQPPSGSR